MTDLSGHSLGRYHLVEQLGEGGMATVYRGFDTRLEREVAVKIIRQDAFPPNAMDAITKRFEREAKSLAKLSHPNIVKILDYGEHDDSPYLVMEYLPGGTLKHLLGKPMPWAQALHLMLPVARGVAYAHQRGILHRDIKPANILITESGEPMLSDFGIAKLFEGEQTTALTTTGMAIGTPEYMAPEQWTGKTGPQSDLYALGVVLYEMITGRKPYVADTPAAILLKQAMDPLPGPRQFIAKLPEEVEFLLIKALARDPAERYSDMNALAAVMEILLARKAVDQSVPFQAESNVIRTEILKSSASVGTVYVGMQDEGVAQSQPISTSPQPPQSQPVLTQALGGLNTPTLVVENVEKNNGASKIPPIASPPTPPVRTPQKPKKKNFLWAGIGLTVFALCLLFASIFILQKNISQFLAPLASATLNSKSLGGLPSATQPLTSKSPEAIASVTKPHPSITPTPALTKTATPSPILIKVCDNKKENTIGCLYAFAPMSKGQMLITLKNLMFVPQYILIGSKKFECQPNKDKATCIGPEVASGTAPLVIYDKNGTNIVLQGEIEIPRVGALPTIPVKERDRDDPSGEQGTPGP